MIMTLGDLLAQLYDLSPTQLKQELELIDDNENKVLLNFFPNDEDGLNYFTIQGGYQYDCGDW
jgi:hypothetical protein